MFDVRETKIVEILEIQVGCGIAHTHLSICEAETQGMSQSSKLPWLHNQYQGSQGYLGGREGRWEGINQHLT